MSNLVYISITGLKLKKVYYAPLFWRYAFGAMSQAQKADGCLSADATTIDGVHHTRSVWTSRKAMLAYLSTGAHLKAMKIHKRIATGKVYGFEANTVPDWEAAQKLWLEKGRDV